jgi:hypothetical protein
MNNNVKLTDEEICLILDKTEWEVYDHDIQYLVMKSRDRRWEIDKVFNLQYDDDMFTIEYHDENWDKQFSASFSLSTIVTKKFLWLFEYKRRIKYSKENPIYVKLSEIINESLKEEKERYSRLNNYVKKVIYAPN